MTDGPKIGDIAPLPPWPEHWDIKADPIVRRAEDIAVGSNALVFGEYRTYRKRWNGRYWEGFGSPVPKYQYRPVSIIGETRYSWITSGGEKYKKRPVAGTGDRRLYGLDDMNDRLWASEHRYRIKSALDSVDVDTLRRVATIIGYNGADFDE